MRSYSGGHIIEIEILSEDLKAISQFEWSQSRYIWSDFATVNCHELKINEIRNCFF